MASRDTLRASIRDLLDLHSPADALAHYYAFHHPSHRAELYVHTDDRLDRADGFLVRAQTGMDLFRPLVTFRARTEAAAQALFQVGLPAGRATYLSIPATLAGWANKRLIVTEAELHRLYRLEPRHFQPMINVLAVTSAGPDGSPRCEIRAQDGQGAVAGVNWQSPEFAEVFVYADPAVRGKGWGRSVVASVAEALLKAGRVPLYIVSESNAVSIKLAETVGFRDTGLREYVAQAVRSE